MRITAPFKQSRTTVMTEDGVTPNTSALSMICHPERSEGPAFSYAALLLCNHGK
jgi:hypothetical protein